MIYADGTHHVQTSVMVPKELHTFAKREGISFSAALRRALEHEREERGRGCNAPTSYPSHRTDPHRDGGEPAISNPTPEAKTVSPAPERREQP